MSASELIFIIAIVLPIIPMLIFKQFRLAAVFGAFYICFGIMEWRSVATTGHTISQLFWEFDAQHPVEGWIIIGAMIAMWTALIIHFKMRNKK